MSDDNAVVVQAWNTVLYDKFCRFKHLLIDGLSAHSDEALNRREYPKGVSLVVSGGVAANKRLRRRLTDLADDAGLRFVAPPPELCTDNGAIIAWAGIERLRLGFVDGLDAPIRPRWPLDNEAPPRPGAGVKG